MEGDEYEVVPCGKRLGGSDTEQRLQASMCSTRASIRRLTFSEADTSLRPTHHGGCPGCPDWLLL